MKQFAVLACLGLAALVSLASARSAEEWKSRVVYQILTDRFAKDTDDSSPCTDLKGYCGGTFNGIIRKLDYLQGLGINAIWISPIPEQTDKGYHGYWQKNLYNINPEFGTSADLHRLVQECHSRGIWVMLDIVANHMGYQGGKDINDFSLLYPFNKSEHYHSFCELNNYNHQPEVEGCRLAGLPDLDQSNSYVRSTLVKWAHQVVTMYDLDGMRVDTTHMISKDFWKEYSQSAGVFTIGEVFSSDRYYVSGYQGAALDSLLDYTMYYRLKDAFRFKKSMRNIHYGVEDKKIFPDPTILGAFLDNHDNHRFLSQNNDWTCLKNALAYIVFAESIPIIYYGTEQGFTGDVDPNNRESLWPHYDTGHWLYMFISTIVKFRVKLGAALYEAPQVERYVDDEFFAFSRGNVFVATTNIGSGGTLSRTITHHPYTDGTKLENILDSTDTVAVEGGKFTVDIKNGQPKVYYPVGLFAGAGECVEDGERFDCGFTGITQQKCEAKGCCWSPKVGQPWCFQNSEVELKCSSGTDCGE